MNRIPLPLTAALLFVTVPVLAHDFRIGTLVIDHPMAFATAKSAMSGAGYLSVTNTGSDADRLLGITADFPSVSLHGTEENDGVMRMYSIAAIEIPAGETVALEPGALHVMSMGLNGDPVEGGEEIPATLIFETAGEVDVVFNVEARGAGGQAIDHSGH